MRVYGILCKETDDIRYIGSTIKPLENRLKEHLSRSAITPIAKWCKESVSRGLYPIIFTLIECDNEQDLRGLESLYINEASKIYPDLLNGKDNPNYIRPRRNLKPKIKKTRISLQVEEKIAELLKTKATADDRTLTNYITYLITKEANK